MIFRDPNVVDSNDRFVNPVQKPWPKFGNTGRYLELGNNSIYFLISELYLIHECNYIYVFLHKNF